MARKVLTGVKHVYITPWPEGDASFVPNEGRLELTDLVADTVSITQDDPESESIDCETRDEPIIETNTLGAYQVEMTSADISHEILQKAMGFAVTADGKIAYAPTSYQTKYVVMEVVMETDTLVVPRALLTSKIDASSLKSETVKGTISGTGFSCDVKSGTEVFQTPFFVEEHGNADTYTVTATLSELNKQKTA